MKRSDQKHLAGAALSGLGAGILNGLFGGGGGLVLIPGLDQLAGVEEALLAGAPLTGELEKHAPWAEELKARYTFTRENAGDILKAEVGKVFARVLEHAGESPAIWAAWGTIVEKRPYLKECLADMVSEGNRFSASWFMAGKPSKKGHPHHPLYLKKDSKIEPFDMESYLQVL